MVGIDKNALESLGETDVREFNSIIRKLDSIFPRNFPNVSNQEISSIISGFKERILSEKGSGNVTTIFSYAVLKTINYEETLGLQQKILFDGLCSAIDFRPWPTMLYVDFARNNERNPSYITSVFFRCLQNKKKLDRRIKTRIENELKKPDTDNEFKKLRIDFNRPIMVSSYSNTGKRVLNTLQRISGQKLLIKIPVEWASEWETELDPELFEVKRVDQQRALSDIKERNVGSLIMGCKVVGARCTEQITEQIEVLNSAGALGYTEKANSAGIPVCLVLGTYKIWPKLSFEAYRPWMVTEERANVYLNDLIPVEKFSCFITEDGVFGLKEFKKIYSRNGFFNEEGLPTSAIRECSHKRSNDVKFVGETIKSLCVPNTDNFETLWANWPLPRHYLMAESHYCETLQTDEKWNKYQGKYAAIVGEKVVSSSESLTDLQSEIRDKYGYGPVFIIRVSKSDTSMLSQNDNFMRFLTPQFRY